jgi:hypothetical protein
MIGSTNQRFVNGVSATEVDGHSRRDHESLIIMALGREGSIGQPAEGGNAQWKKDLVWSLRMGIAG